MFTVLTPNLMTAVQMDVCQALSIFRSSCLVSTEKYLEFSPQVCSRKQCCRSSTFSDSLIIRNIDWYTLNLFWHLFTSSMFTWNGKHFYHYLSIMSTYYNIRIMASSNLWEEWYTFHPMVNILILESWMGE